MNKIHRAPDQGRTANPATHCDPELRAYSDEQAQDVFESVLAHMPFVLPLMAALLIFMLAFIAVPMARVPAVTQTNPRV